jgi:hypothetical protein
MSHKKFTLQTLTRWTHLNATLAGSNERRPSDAELLERWYTGGEDSDALLVHEIY